MCKPLNKEQQILAEKNHNLVFKFLKDHNLGMDEIDDWYGVVAIGLCKAASVYDVERGVAFSTLAYAVMQNEYVRVLRSRKSVMCSASLDEILSEETEESLYNLLPVSGNVYSTVDLYCAMEDVEKDMTDVERNAVRMIVEGGAKLAEVADDSGLSRYRVSSIFKTYQRKLRHKLSNQE